MKNIEHIKNDKKQKKRINIFSCILYASLLTLIKNFYISS